MNDKDYRLWINLAISYRWLNDDAKALDAYRRALPLVEEVAKLRPQDAGVQVRAGTRDEADQRRREPGPGSDSSR